MIVKVGWTDGQQSTFTNIFPIRNRYKDGNILFLNSKDRTVTREIYCDKVNFITFIEEPDDQELLNQ